MNEKNIETEKWIVIIIKTKGKTIYKKETEMHLHEDTIEINYANTKKKKEKTIL